MVDYYPDEEGYISDGTIVGFCKALNSISLHQSVAFGTTNTTSYISVVAGAYTTGVGIALKAADTNDYIPVAFKGIVKQTANTAVAIPVGRAVVAGTTAGYVSGIETIAAGTDVVFITYQNIVPGATTRNWRLGYALQTATTDGDEILVMLAGLT
jgi:hypothetical protein